MVTESSSEWAVSEMVDDIDVEYAAAVSEALPGLEGERLCCSLVAELLCPSDGVQQWVSEGDRWELLMRVALLVRIDCDIKRLHRDPLRSERECCESVLD